MHRRGTYGATEKKEWKNREQIAWVENAGVAGKPHGNPNRYYTAIRP